MGDSGVTGLSPPGIVVLHRSPQVRRAVALHLRPTRRPLSLVSTVDEARAALRSTVPELLMVEQAAVEAAPDLLAEAAASGVRSCVIAVAPGDTGTMVVPPFASFALSSAGAFGPPRQIDELAVTALKLLRGDLFGMAKYLTWGCVPEEHRLTRAADRHAVRAALVSDVARRGYGPRLRWLAAQTADELLTNALFHGPVDDRGHHVRAAMPRGDDFALDDGNEVVVRWGADDRYFAIEVVDPWGSLEIDTLFRCVRRALTPGLAPRPRGSAGAGLGLALSAAWVHHLVCNLDPGRRTELVALFDVRGPDVRLDLAPSFHACVVASSMERAA